MPVEDNILDVPRFTEYNPNPASAGPFDVGFPVFGTDDVKVFLDDVETTAFTFAGTFVNGVSLDATITLDAAFLGHLDIQGALSPQRTDQYVQGKGVPAQSHNLSLNHIWAATRELYDLTRGGVYGALHEAKILRLPTALERAGKIPSFDGTGDITVISPGSVSGPAGPAGDAIFYDTKAFVEGATVPGTVNMIFTNGRSAVGDGGHGSFKRVVSEPSHAGKIQSGDGAWWELADPIANAKTFGAVGDNVAIDTTALQDWFTYVTTVNGHGHIPTGTYLINATISNITLARDYRVTLARDAVITTTLNMNVPMFNTTGTGVERAEWVGGRFDFTNGQHDVGLQSSTALAFTDIEELIVLDGDFIGATNDFRDETGDSAITEVNVTHGFIARSRFFGWSDNAIYLSGGASVASTDDGAGFLILGNYFERNNIGITSRRKRRGARIIGNTFARNGVDFLESLISGLGSGQRSIVVSNYSKGAISRSINMRVSTGGIVANNIIEDVGYDLDDLAVATATGIVLEGCTETVVANNVVRLDERANHAGHRGITMGPITFELVTTESADNLINGNAIADMTFGIRELGVPGPNYGRANLITNTGADVTLINAGSDIRGLEFVRRLRSTLPSAPVSLAGGGTQTATLVVPLTGVAAGDEVVINAVSATMFNPAFRVIARAATDSVQVKVQNDAGSALALSVELFDITVTRQG